MIQMFAGYLNGGGGWGGGGERGKGEVKRLHSPVKGTDCTHFYGNIIESIKYCE